MSKFKLTWKMWLLLIILILSIMSVFGLPPVFLEKGVLVTSVEQNSTAFNQGFRQGQVIKSIDGNSVESLSDFTQLLQGKFISNQSQKVVFTMKNSEVIYFSSSVPDITVSEIPTTNIKLGLDMAGGSRALVKAEGRDLSRADVQDLVSITENRLNEFGITDLKVLPISDLEGNNFMLVELAGNNQDLRSLLEQQGKFEAKIGEEVVFIGGERDIASVCRGDPSCARIEPPVQAQGGYISQFSFEITLSADAARRHADITAEIGTNSSNPGYLEKPLDLYLDDNLVDSLLISEGLKGRVTTLISISGSGSGETAQDAIEDAEEEMHHLQTVLITGSLPYKLEIVKLDTISPVLGDEFTRTILTAGLVALLAASLIVFVRYRSVKSSLALILISFCEVVIILGVASRIEWNLDLPSIAGILAAIGTGFDDQIIILDEARREKFISIKQRLKRAFAIIFGAYFTAAVSLLPLLWAGAGLLKGFAFTTLIGISIGVFITRPAFADVVKRIEKE
jgi:preprotein translocase subunit SecD